MSCPHWSVTLTEEPVRLSHCVSGVHWFTCDACGERAAVATRTELFLERG